MCLRGDVEDEDVLGLSDEDLLALPRPPCPACAAVGQLIPRVYGMPSPDDPLLQRAERGEVDVEFAGCVIPMAPLPVWRCRHCDALVAEDGTQVEDDRFVEDSSS
jgi:hypothetical protein